MSARFLKSTLCVTTLCVLEMCVWTDSDCTESHLGIKALFCPTGSLHLSATNAKINQKLSGKTNRCSMFQYWNKEVDFHGKFGDDSHRILSEVRDNESILVQTETGGVSNHCLFSVRGVIVFPFSTGSDSAGKIAFFIL